MSPDQVLGLTVAMVAGAFFCGFIGWIIGQESVRKRCPHPTWAPYVERCTACGGTREVKA